MSEERDTSLDPQTQAAASVEMPHRDTPVIALATGPRQLTSHKVNGLNECITIEVLDEPGQGNACHEYRISGLKGPLDHHPIPTIGIRFQKGPVQENGYNGISNEALLAIVEDRLLGFQSGPYACRENACALTKIQEAMMWLHKRTRDRVARGVEGTIAR
jgi:hypothetical protein